MTYRSKLEGDVAVALSQQGHPVNYEQTVLAYVTHQIYVPDFHLESEHGLIYIEVKGRYTSADRSKTLRVISSNPEIRLFVALQQPNQRLSKTSKRTYAKWCNDHGIPWCPTPIPPDYLQQWLNGLRPTYRARPAAVQMQLL